MTCRNLAYLNTLSERRPRRSRPLLLILSGPHITTNEGSGAFLLASDGGLDGGDGRDDGEEPHLPIDAPRCLKKVPILGLCETISFSKKRGNWFYCRLTENMLSGTSTTSCVTMSCTLGFLRPGGLLANYDCTHDAFHCLVLRVACCIVCCLGSLRLSQPHWG